MRFSLLCQHPESTGQTVWSPVAVKAMARLPTMHGTGERLSQLFLPTMEVAYAAR